MSSPSSGHILALRYCHYSLLACPRRIHLTPLPHLYSLFVPDPPDSRRAPFRALPSPPVHPFSSLPATPTPAQALQCCMAFYSWLSVGAPLCGLVIFTFEMTWVELLLFPVSIAFTFTISLVRFVSWTPAPSTSFCFVVALSPFLLQSSHRYFLLLSRWFLFLLLHGCSHSVVPPDLTTRDRSSNTVPTAVRVPLVCRPPPIGDTGLKCWLIVVPPTLKIRPTSLLAYRYHRALSLCFTVRRHLWGVKPETFLPARSMGRTFFGLSGRNVVSVLTFHKRRCYTLSSPNTSTRLLAMCPFSNFGTLVLLTPFFLFFQSCWSCIMLNLGLG